MEFLRSNTSFRGSCDELLLKEAIQYHEKIDYSHFSAFGGRLNARVLLERTRDDHNHNASNHCDCAAAARYYNDDNPCDGRLLSRLELLM